jgi:PAS domain S-box-containing protein/diguanylate cyclase (GGDEF)-like protein
MSSSSTAPVAGSAFPDLRSLVEHVQAAVYVIQDERICYANPASAELLGWPLDEMVGLDCYAVARPEDRDLCRQGLQRCLAGEAGRPAMFWFRRRDGSRFEGRVFASRIEFNGRVSVLVSLIDLTEQQEANGRAEWNAGMLQRTEALCRTGSFEIVLPAGDLVLSAGLRSLIGGPPRSVDADHLDALPWIPCEERALVAGFWRDAVPGEPFEFQHRLVTAEGQRLVVLHRGRLESRIDGVGRGVAILQDISVQREAELRIQELANQDEITGLPNRASLLDQLDAALHAARWGEHAVALMTIEVPRIDEVRAKMGFGAGDTLAMALAARLKTACAAEGEVVAHLGGAEFALIVESGGAATPIGLQQRALALQRAFDAPVRLGATDIYSRCRIGISSFPADGDNAERLLENAQTARLATGSGQEVALFRPETTARALREMEIESLLSQALERGELVLHYQPEVDLANGRICAGEALLRWTSPVLGPVSPAEFIPIAERSGLIGHIGEWVLEQVCRQAAAWHRAGLPTLRLGVNLSPVQLQRPDFARHVQAVLLATGAPPAWLGVEITETTLMSDVERANAVLSEIKAIGVEISLDDFGTGFSSLSYLRRLPIDVLKVDRSFVHDVTGTDKDVSVTRAIISMAHSLQMQVLAEGVETEGQLSLLAANGCNRIQGFWFSKPVPAADFEALVREPRCLPERFIQRGRRTRTLLLVDDEENILSSLKRLLRRDGYHIVTATSAAEGLQRLAEHEVDVIISDQRMPGMTGVEFLRRAKVVYPDTIRMVLSGYTELQSIIDAVNEGAIYKFLTKPWDDERLREHVAEAFRQKDLADENRRLSRQVETANADLAVVNARLERLLAQQHNQAELLEASAGGMREMIEGLPAAVLGLDPDGLVVFVNREAEAVFNGIDLIGSPADEVLDIRGGSLAPVLHVGDQSWRLVRREFTVQGQPRGHLLLLLPHELAMAEPAF